MELPCISLWQPWASLIFAGVKHHETRHWRPPSRLIGHRIAIHAAKRVQGTHYIPSDLDNLCFRLFGQDWPKSLPLGAVLGTAVLADVRSTNDEAYVWGADGVDRLCGDWSHGRVAWRLTAVTPLPAPIPTVGRQGFFTFNMEPTYA